MNSPDDWDKLRRKIYARDNYTCQTCGATDEVVHAHHIVPKSAGGTDDEENLKTLCGKCHAMMHRLNALTFWLLVPCLWQLGIKFGGINEEGGLRFSAKDVEGLCFTWVKKTIYISDKQGSSFGFKATALLPIEYLDSEGNVISSLPEDFLDALISLWEKLCIERIKIRKGDNGKRNSTT